MGRKRKEIDPIKVHELSLKGMTQKDMAKELGVSHVTLARRMGEIRAEQGILLKYRNLQNLQLTALQFKILEAVIPEKMEEASLVDLVRAFKILKDAEREMVNEKVNITGLVGYLLELEEQEKNAKANSFVEIN